MLSFTAKLNVAPTGGISVTARVAVAVKLPEGSTASRIMAFAPP